MNRPQKISIVLAILAFLIVRYFIFEKHGAKTSSFLPRYIGYNVRNDHFGKEGLISYQIFANKVTAYPKNNQTEFINPKLTMYNIDKATNKKTQWNITSKTGQLYHQNKLILTGNVLVDNTTKDQFIQTMKTEQLTALLDKKEIMTDLPVQWTGPQIEESGVGMWASFITKELIVKDKVNAVYFYEKK